MLQVIYSEVLQSNRQSGSGRPSAQQNGMPPAGPGAPGPMLPKDFDCIGPAAYPRIPSVCSPVACLCICWTSALPSLRASPPTALSLLMIQVIQQLVSGTVSLCAASLPPGSVCRGACTTTAMTRSLCLTAGTVAPRHRRGRHLEAPWACLVKPDSLPTSHRQCLRAILLILWLPMTFKAGVCLASLPAPPRCPPRLLPVRLPSELFLQAPQFASCALMPPQQGILQPPTAYT